MIYEAFNRNVVVQINTRYHEESIWIATSFTGISAFKDRVFAMRKQFRWSIVLGTDKMLIYPVEAYTAYLDLQYPFEIEGKIKKAICNENSEVIKKYSKDFLHIINRNKYHPDSIIEAFVKLVSAIFLMIRELNTGLYEQLGHQKYLKQIMEAITLNELSSIYNGLTEKIILYQGKKEDISNYTIKRALNHIKNHYKEGITLEETALNIDITPEYLSMLFNREVGTNFNLFIKEFRIGKAKKLLIGSEMKIYEIAQEVGYNDSKYFCRVFKEIVGLSPSDYRNTN
jgi:YesN/AraC family two-component response regulator